VGTDPAGDAQAEALAALAERLSRDTGLSRVPQVGALPEKVDRHELPLAGDATRRVAVGLNGATLAPAWVRFDDVPLFLVCGPDGSGRSAALATLTGSLVAADPSLDAYLLAPRRSPLVDEHWWKEAARGPDACEALASRLAEEVRARQSMDGPSLLIVVDDGDELIEGRVATSLEAVVKRGRDAGLIFLASCQTHVAHRAFGGWITDVKRAKHGLLLIPDIEVDGDIFGARLPRRTLRSYPPGRGYLVLRGSTDLVQVAS
jgi:S-DNA-T family DNA segregation ATPase FtsK/SpoIIIE